MDIQKFDPFQDRLSRDIRNTLSDALVLAIRTRSAAPISEAAAIFRQAASPVHRRYITDRKQRYRQVLDIIGRHDIADPVTQALVLWDHGLFFEVHELLEEHWLAHCGPGKEILQAFIRAAGVYVHLEQGNLVGARKMADKALAAFRRHHGSLPSHVDIGTLIDKLERLDPAPPRLFEKSTMT